MENHTQFLHVLMLLHESEVMKNDEEFWNFVKSLAEKNTDEEESIKMRKYIGSFIEFYKKHPSISAPALANEPNHKTVRMYVDGCFDLMHSGHFNAIRQAKALCDVLVVGVISDQEIEYNKGPPVMTLSERAEIAAACKWADEVVFDNIPYNPTIELIDKYNCQYVAHGDDLALSADGKDSYHEIKAAGRMKVFKRTDGISTTDIVGRLLLATKQNQPNESSTALRRLSEDNIITTSNLEKVYEEKKENQPKEKVQMIQTTRRIRQFSSGKEPKPTDHIVYIDGSFDILHVGHVKILKKAKEQGDFLIVGIHDDETVNSQKGGNYPVMTLQERVLNVLAMRYVDEVIIGAPWKITENMIKTMNIQIVVEGAMTKFHENENMPYHLVNDPYEVPKKLGIYRQISSGCNISTETIVERIIENRMKFIKAHEIKKQKLENYYKTKDFNIAENQKGNYQEF